MLFFSNSFFIRVWLIHRVESISTIQHSDPVVHVCVCIHILFLILSSIMCYPKRLDIVPVLYSRAALLINSKWNRLKKKYDYLNRYQKKVNLDESTPICVLRFA